MQLNNEFAQVTKSSNKMETGQASIEMTAHMFQILSAGIYEHPERACIRELSCNAIDGQTAAGNPDQPFRVHLPTQLEPYFEVRDFGTGMTHDQVMKLYLTYGASTKRGSNDQIGGLGIGSKSPFAVAQSFTATSYVDGVVRRYSVYMEEGIPQVTKLTESATTEPNGMAVRVAIPLNKIEKFHKEANRIYTHFPVKPECNVELDGIYDGWRILAKSEGEFTIYSGNNTSGTVDTSIVMGNIEYPIELENVLPNYDKIIPDYLSRSISKALIYLPIGSVNIAASRESLQLTESTKKEIESVFNKVANEILSTFQTEVDKAANLFEAWEIYLNAASSGHRDNLRNLMHYVTYDGKTFAEWSHEQSESRRMDVVDPATGTVMLDRYGKPQRTFSVEALDYLNIYSVYSNSNNKRLETRSTNSASDLSIFSSEMMPNSLRKRTLFVIEDRFNKNGSQKTAGRSAVLQAIVTDFCSKGGDHNGRMFLFSSLAEIQATAKLHHYPESVMSIYKTSDFESAYVPKKVIRGQVKLWRSVSGASMTELKVSLDDYDSPQYYLRAEGNDIVSESLNRYHGASDAIKILSRAVPTGEVFLFRKTVWNKIPEDWVEIDDKLIKQLVKDNPQWYIDLNRRALRLTASYAHPGLDHLGMRLVSNLNNKKVNAGGTQINYRTRLPDPRAVNFEDNMEVIEKIFGRISIVFADIFYSADTYSEVQLISKLVAMLPKDDKIRSKVDNAQERAEEVCKKELKRVANKNKLLSWIDWGKVSFREVAEHLGYTLTNYVEK